MKLIPEQVKDLREKREGLLKSRQEYIEQCSSRDYTAVDGIGSQIMADFTSDLEYSKSREKIVEIDSLLKKSEFVSDRNFECIDIGTGFKVAFDDGFDFGDKIILIDASSPITSMGYTPVDSDFGKAVLGKKVGDEVSYKVKETGVVVNCTVSEIDNIRDHYTHFIREKRYHFRSSRAEREILQELRDNDPVEYEKRKMITLSQKELIEEEISQLTTSSRNRSIGCRIGQLEKRLKYPIAPLPEDDSIGVGSYVTIALDIDGEVEEYSFEMINSAVSTELEDHYVERISSLGHSIYGLKAGDHFHVHRWHQTTINGVVLDVNNEIEDVKIRVK